MVGVSRPIQQQVWVQDHCHTSSTITYFLKTKLLLFRIEARTMENAISSIVRGTLNPIVWNGLLSQTQEAVDIWKHDQL